MTPTDKGYNTIAQRVYDVDPVKHPSGQRKKGSQFVADGKTYQVIDAIGNDDEPTDNSLQGMAVAPVDKDGNVDYSHVVISYAGTNFGDSNDVGTDLQGLGLGNPNSLLTKLPTLSQTFEYYLGNSEAAMTKYLADSAVRGQPEGAVDFAQRVYAKAIKHNPNATFSTTGHSLGEALAMYVALKLGWNNVGYNGPDIGNMISPQEIDYMRKHPNQFRNFRNPNDILGNSTGNKTGTAIWVKMNDKDIKDFLNSVLWDFKLPPGAKSTLIYYYFDRNHGASTWQFKNGQVIDIDGNVILAQNDTLAATLLTTVSMANWAKMKTTLSAGGFSANEKIFLDSSQAQIIADGFGHVAEAAHDEIGKKVATAKQVAQELYDSLGDVSWGMALSPDEMRSAYAAGGVDYASTVQKIDDYSQTVLDKSKTISSDIVRLKDELKSGIEKMLEQDSKLAGEFSQWKSMM